MRTLATLCIALAGVALAYCILIAYSRRMLREYERAMSRLRPVEAHIIRHRIAKGDDDK